MINQGLTKYAGTHWTGRGELWLDPEGNNTNHYPCELRIESDVISYTWIHEDISQKGSFTFNENGASWVDSWHQPKSVQCTNTPEAWSIFNVHHIYEVDWGWQSKLSERPDGTLVLQMTNITPWGEDGRAVRMVFSRVKA